MAPSKKRPGLSNIARRFIFMPIEATRIYKKIVPIFDAPTPSSSLTLVKERASPMLVVKTTTQKKELYRESKQQREIEREKEKKAH